MTPEQRKAASEARIQSLDLPVNENLRLLAADDEVQLRSPEEVLQRMIALWAVVGSAMIPGNRHFHRYIVGHRFQPWLSTRESRFLLKEDPGEAQRIQYSWQLEPLYFIGWCAGLIEHIGIPQGPSSLKDMVSLFPKDMTPPDRLKAAIRIRSTAEIMDQVDLVYRLDWGVRHVQPAGDDTAPAVNAGVIQEWHRAANWMIRHKGQDDWDHIEIGA
jgi:hypothetical protein